MNRSRIALSLVLAGFVPCSAVAQPPPDVAELLAVAIEAGEGEDREAWARYAFQRHVLRQRLSEEGAVEWTQRMRFQVTPTADGGFDEVLLEIDGRTPTAAEVEEHREAGRFQKRYENSAEAALSNPFGPDLAILPLFFDQEHEYVGLEELDGIPCHRIRWQAREEPKHLPVQERLKYATKGTLCIAVDSPRMMQAHMETTREVKKGPVKMSHVRIAFDARPVGGVYLTTGIEMVSQVKLPGKKYRTHNTYRFTDYEKRR